MVLVAKRQKRTTSFGARLRSLRESAGLSQSELGERAGTTYQNIARYERGAVEPNWPTVLTLAEALGVTPDAFLDPDQPDQDDEPDPPARPAKRK